MSRRYPSGAVLRTSRLLPCIGRARADAGTSRCWPVQARHVSSLCLDNDGNPGRFAVSWIKRCSLPGGLPGSGIRMGTAGRTADGASRPVRSPCGDGVALLGLPFPAPDQPPVSARHHVAGGWLRKQNCSALRPDRMHDRAQYMMAKWGHRRSPASGGDTPAPAESRPPRHFRRTGAGLSRAAMPSGRRQRLGPWRQRQGLSSGRGAGVGSTVPRRWSSSATIQQSMAQAAPMHQPASTSLGQWTPR